MPDRAPEIGEYKGHPTITIFTGKEYQGEAEKITLGIRKAKAICDQIDHIYKFVREHE